MYLLLVYDLKKKQKTKDYVQKNYTYF